MGTKVSQIVRKKIVGDLSQHHYTIILEVDGRRKRYTAVSGSVDAVLKDAYFFHTANELVISQDPDGWTSYEFTDQLADPDDFTHLEKVPPWAELPF